MSIYLLGWTRGVSVRGLDVVGRQPRGWGRCGSPTCMPSPVGDGGGTPPVLSCQAGAASGVGAVGAAHTTVPCPCHAGARCTHVYMCMSPWASRTFTLCLPSIYIYGLPGVHGTAQPAVRLGSAVVRAWLEKRTHSNCQNSSAGNISVPSQVGRGWWSPTAAQVLSVHLTPMSSGGGGAGVHRVYRGSCK